MDVIQIDDGYQKAMGDWSLNHQFPEGWPPVLDDIRATGAVPGLWMAPLLVSDRLPLFAEKPDWFQRDAAGKLVPHLDPTHPEVQRWLTDLLREKRQLGFEYFKLDFNFVHASTRFHDPTRTRLQAFRDLYRLYREALGPDVYLLACTVSLQRAVAGYADAVRIGVDSMAAWKEDHGICISQAIRAVGATSPAHGRLFTNDPDVTYTWPHHLTTDQWRTWHSFVGLLGGTAMVSEPLFLDRLPLGRVELSFEAGMLRLEATVHEAALFQQPRQPWEASCIELFACPDSVGATASRAAGNLTQLFLVPAAPSATGARPAAVLRPSGDELIAEPAAHIQSETVPGGYRLTAAAPLEALGLNPADQALRAEVRLFATPDPRQKVFSATLFGSVTPHKTSAGYGRLTLGQRQARDLEQPSIRATLRELEILAPPVDLGVRSLVGGRDDWHRAFGALVSRPWGDAAVVLLWNPADQPAPVRFPLDLLPGLVGPVHAWSFWDETYLGVVRDELQVPLVPPHAPLLLRLTPCCQADESPHVVGSNLHITAGAAELAEVVATPRSLHISLHDRGARDGSLFVFSHRPLRLTEARGLDASPPQPTGQPKLHRIDLRNRRRHRPQTLHLALD